MISGLVAIAMQTFVLGTSMDVTAVADGVAKPTANASIQGTSERTITYTISSKGVITGNIEEFRKIVAETLADNKGWKRAGVKFVEVASGGSMWMVLAAGNEVGAFNGCSATLSCVVYPYVLINDARWMSGSDSYNALGLSLSNYRQMVINHEVGHYLGHNHITTCETGTGLAPVMLQQSTGLLGCLPNPWPLPGELWYTR
ncbi:DUF3152 domain-containing protein [Candidatus Saccharibacteria bacterium]|jgi:hypothetical protein|nr:DUF3152 domain-containing protein [Candidatus Saccharibacteria bacterium]